MSTETCPSKNKTIGRRNAIKDTMCYGYRQGRGLISADATVVTISDPDNDEQKVVNSEHYASDFGTLRTTHHVFGNRITVDHDFHVHADVFVNTSTFDDAELFVLKLRTEDCPMPDGEFNLYTDKAKARQIAEAILAELDGEEAIDAR